MDPILSEIYSTVLGAAPFVVAAYSLMWLVLLVYLVIVMSGLKRTEREMSALAEQLKAHPGPLAATPAVTPPDAS